MEETFKDIKGYEGLYQVSNLGNVKTLSRIVKSSVGFRKTKERLLIPNLGRNGYKTVALRKDNKAKTTPIHIILCREFSPNPENKRTVNHKDGIKTNITDENLEWATHGENNAHAYRTGLKKPVGLNLKGKECKNSRLIYQYTKEGKYVNEFYGCYEAERITGIQKTNINSVLSGIRRYAGGFNWSLLKWE